MPKEVVSPQVVANWFANKRKELRRRSNDECNEVNNANLSQVVSSFDLFNLFKLQVFFWGKLSFFGFRAE